MNIPYGAAQSAALYFNSSKYQYITVTSPKQKIKSHSSSNKLIINIYFNFILFSV